MPPHSAAGRVAAHRPESLERIAALSRSWLFTLLSAIVAIGALASCESVPLQHHAARD